MTSLRIEPEAEDELAAAAEWYEARRAGLGVELVAMVDAAIESILSAPTSHPIWRAERPYRKTILRRFPYVIFFTVDQAGRVTVVAIAHARRVPGYWQSRVENTR